ncbi:hypothetical protein Poli38472_007817 [Pythium oligandrum]|uniref:Secreted protein n=1 Tax=Pythium oligandrum TaxID=41045 RepID=A0A8K1FLE0_PYTOL|nr:hypothetical protein Poli38472_007817 [Pythium oligandrum]|eukprot:TMW68145.1 hypothetical protein Poli38472_007817 [Pythium oligandrum]
MKHTSVSITKWLHASLAASLFIVAASTECKSITDKSSPFIGGIIQLLGESTLEAFPVDKIGASVEASFPELAKCIANIPAVSALATVTSNPKYQSCSTDASAFSMNTTSDETIRSQLCPFYNKTVLPCIGDLGVTSFLNVMTTSNGCCDDFKAQMDASLGTDLHTVVSSMLERTGNVICSTKTFQSQIPNDQACTAMGGEQFTSSSKLRTQFSWSSTGVTPVGICYKPVSNLVGMVSQLPIISSWKVTVNGESVSMSDLFANGKCVKTNALLAWATDKTGFVMKTLQLADDVLATLSGAAPAAASGTPSSETNMTVMWTETAATVSTYASSLCLHIANGETCSFSSSESLALAYQTNEPDSAPSSAHRVSVNSGVGLRSLALAVLATFALV